MSYPNTQLLIAGEWQEAADGRTLPVFNPATGEEIGRVAHAGIADLDRALAAAQKAKEYPQRRAIAVPAAGRLYRTFAEQCGSLRCEQICGLDLTTPEGVAQLAAGARDEKCAPAVAKAARLLAEELNRIAAL